MKRAAQDSDNEDHLQRRAKVDDTDTDGNGGNSDATTPSFVKPTEKKEDDADIVDESDKDDKKAEAKEEEAPTGKDTNTMDDAGKSQPHRKPKNFAERLMRSLQDEVGKDAIWWMPNGKAIAIHTRKLRDNEDLLMEHFKVKDYSVFIRNCNRWGFRRTVQYQVDQGVITYECSLFDRENPHLVRHMRMDSDVQDVFVRHRDTEGSEVPFDPKRIGRANYASRGVTASESEASAPLEEGNGSPRQHQPPNNGGGLGFDLRAVAAASGFGNQHFLGHHQMNLPAGMGSFANNSSFLHNLQGRDPYLQQMMAQGSAAHAADPPGSIDRTAPTSAPLATSEEMKAALTRLLANQSQQTGSESQQQSGKRKSILGEGTSVDALLDLILTLSDEYLNHPATASPSTESICMAMKLLKIQGEKYKEEKTAKNPAAAAAAANNSEANILDSLRSQLSRGGGASSQSHQGMAERTVQADQLYQTSQQLIGSPGLLRGAGDEDSLADQLRKQQLERMLMASRDNGLSPQAMMQLAQSMGIPPQGAGDNQASINQLMQLLQQNRSQGGGR